jgi:hypothetical protein
VLVCFSFCYSNVPFHQCGKPSLTYAIPFTTHPVPHMFMLDLQRWNEEIDFWWGQIDPAKASGFSYAKYLTEREEMETNGFSVPWAGAGSFSVMGKGIILWGIFENHPWTSAYFIILLTCRNITHGANFQSQMVISKP